MRHVDTQKLSKEECWGIQIYGLNHCKNINCRWQGLSACAGKNIVKTGYNSLGFKVGENGLAQDKTKEV